MTILRRVAGVAVVLCGVAAAAIIAVGVPITLAKGFGWPLPHAVPSWSEISAALQGGIPDIVWIDTLACVCWAAWLYLVTTLSLEAVATARGVAATRLALTKPGQRLAATLIATVVFGVALLSTRPTPSRGTAPLAAAIHAARLADSIVTPLPAPSAAGSSGPAPAASTSTEQVMVRSGDTLWGIAGRELHNSTRWPAIWQANEHRVEADGRRFDNPHWIYPHWQLDVPGAVAEPPTAAIPNVAPPPSPPSTPPTPATMTPAQPPSTPGVAPAPVSTAPAALGGPRPSPSATPTGQPVDSGITTAPAGWTVTLARDGLIGGGLAAGLATLLLAAQRYERWRRRPSDRGRSRVALMARRPNMLRLRGALAAAGRGHGDSDEDGTALGGGELQAMLTIVQSVPGRILVGQRGFGGGEVIADIDQLNGLTVSGSGADSVARAVLISFLAHHPWEMAQALIGGFPGGQLIAAGTTVPGLQLHPVVDAFLAQLQREVAYQRSILDREHLDSWRGLASSGDPLPALLAVVRAEDLSPAQLERLDSMVSAARGCAIAVIVLGSAGQLDWGRPLAVEADGTVEPTSAGVVNGAGVLYHVAKEEAEELLAVVAAGRGPDIVPEISEDEEATVALAASSGDVAQPHEPGTSAALPSLQPRAVDVRIFGRVRVLVNGSEVEKGLPASGRQVLALLVVRGELTEAQGVDAFSAGNPSSYYANQWAAGTRKTRTALRELLADRGIDCLPCVGGRFRLNDEIVSSDYRRLVSGRAAARQIGDPEARRALLASATRDVRGEPFANAAYNWLIEDETAVRSLGMATLEELANLHAAAGDLDAAVMALDQALSLDPDPVEAVFQQMLVLQHRLGHGEAVRDLYRRLQHQLAVRCDREPSAETESLMESLGSAPRLVVG